MRLSLSVIVTAFACVAFAAPYVPVDMDARELSGSIVDRSPDQLSHLPRADSASTTSSEGDTRLTVYYASSLSKDRVEGYAVTAINDHLAKLGLPNKPVASKDIVFHAATSGSATATATHVSFELWNAPKCGDAPNHHCVVTADVANGQLTNIKIKNGAGKVL
ncbi:hypothetical protein GYMLUDRAFT_63693 [Collybiopsis luxurians FD-317 M1]|uniref:Uncharacterized protein n=1 Tax=Collybiopsis luxurians FD-317 M1 TaxID=944289 RepID=A0A0D0CEM3_9AGAR|nr:hypothetical protein GYMLUDRAFT_63693 [Collybiopsis luxurians FD-317 M1]